MCIGDSIKGPSHLALRHDACHEGGTLLLIHLGKQGGQLFAESDGAFNDLCDLPPVTVIAFLNRGIWKCVKEGYLKYMLVI